MSGSDETIQPIVGLGNPGTEYAHTRHNMGFMVIDSLLASLPGSYEKRHCCESYAYYGRYRGQNLLMQQPLTFMNSSGKAVKRLIALEKLDCSKILVVYDDLDLPLGKLRIKRGGSSGGHHGIDSIIAELGSSSFLRLRVGIGSSKKNTIDHVLGTFDASENELALTMVKQATEAIKVILSRGSARAANQYNGLDYANQVFDECAGKAGDAEKEN